MTHVAICDAGTGFMTCDPSAHVLNLLYSFSLGDGLPIISISKYYTRLKRQHIT